MLNDSICIPLTYLNTTLIPEFSKNLVFITKLCIILCLVFDIILIK
ncbi:hypothetical protein BN1326_30052 [Staphylococcus argenteus]|uniref:Uncharacterized protein n=1 Tax=Staphylococcus argenteus TaxID=985002 RepID=A0A7U7PXF4_9STAP|nr:hypothetical protein BN1326_30052 [Staphylococcus argenteus]CRI20256.1 hypothetical protein BN1326_30052 [Staphylococcus argenteus]